MSANSRKQRLMILGAADAQVPIIEKVKAMGFEAIVVSAPGEFPGFEVATRFYEIDVRDREGVLAVARQEDIRGILTDQTDIAVPTVAYVAEQLGLPGVGEECAQKFTNKYLMRRAAEAAGVPVPRFFEASGVEDAEHGARSLTYPLIVKPVDSQGSRGVSLVKEPAMLAEKVAAAQRHSPAGQVIVEEFFAGREVVVQGIVSDFAFSNLAIGDRIYFTLPELFIPKATVFPSLLPESLQARIQEFNHKLICGLKPRFGITHSEFLVNERSGEVRLVETAIRGGGVFISSDLVPISSGVDIGRLLIEHACGQIKRADIDLSTLKKRAAGYFCFYLPEGEIVSVEGVDAVKRLPGVHRVILDKIKVGWRTPPLSDKTARLGPILIVAEDRAQCHQTYEMVKRTLNVLVRTESGVEGICWE